MAPALVFGQDVDLALELGVRMHGARFCDDLAALDLFALDAAQQHADVVASLCKIECLAEHFEAGDDRLLFLGGEADDFDIVADFCHAALHSSGCDRAAAADSHNVLDRHQEGQVGLAVRRGDKVVDRIHQLQDGLVLRRVDVGGFALEGLQGGAADDRGLVAREAVFGQQVADLHFHQVQQFGVVNLVDLVHINDDIGHAHLAGQQDMLARLGHGAVGGRHNQDGSVHLRGARNHVLDIVGVAGAVDMRVVALVGLVLHVGRVDGDAARTLFRGLVNIGIIDEAGLVLHGKDFRDSRRKGCFAMVDMADGANVDMGFGPVKFCFCHGRSSFIFLYLDLIRFQKSQNSWDSCFTFYQQNGRKSSIFYALFRFLAA